MTKDRNSPNEGEKRPLSSIAQRMRNREGAAHYRPSNPRRSLRGREPYMQVAGTTRWIRVSSAFILELSKAYSLVFSDGTHCRTYVQAIPRKVWP